MDSACDAIRTRRSFIWPNDEERLALHKLEPKQDLFSIRRRNPGTFYHPEGGYQGTVSYVNSEHLAQGEYQGSTESVAPRSSSRSPRSAKSISSTAMLTKAYSIAIPETSGSITASASVQWCQPYVPSRSPPRTGHVYFRTGDGRYERRGAINFPMNTVGVLMGCDIVRVGFEDTSTCLMDSLRSAIMSLLRRWLTIARNSVASLPRLLTRGRSSISGTLDAKRF